MRKKLIWIAILLFIVTNGILVWMDDDGKVNRKAHVSDWDMTFEADLFDTVEAPGVIAYSGESYVYFDETAGSFQGFSLEEGNEINVGDPLFTYRVNDFAETEAFLVSELEKVNGEITAIEDAITEMVAYEIPRPTIPVISQGEEDENENISPPREPVEADLLKKQYLIEKEMELSARKEQALSIQSQLEELQSNGDTITVESPYQGKVKTISTTLSDPLIVIEDTKLVVQGELQEDERKQVEQGLPVHIDVSDSDDHHYQGVIEEVGVSPVDGAEITNESKYAFEVLFDDGEELDALLPGYHADISVILDDAMNATVVREDRLFDDHLWKLTEVGKIQKVPVQSGIRMDGSVEVKDGASTGEWILTEELSSVYADTTFVTPFKITKAPWLKLGDYENWKKYLIIGILSR
ncbi:efflux RND transporter periplasmic adaptor subunit [Ornithinibacillus salinisoli]|uniref:Efflux RND transporter periplasmic adaptor subunit n=1 Tax=Ornithinibacillus salinisoli TaxID=1848459 RepID=A0ABW4VWQ9_9BACI